ncbi:period circadian protein homolog 2-like [Aulostomus maculatus]
MSENSDPKHYLYSTLDGCKLSCERVSFQVEQREDSSCSSISQLHCMASSYSEGCGGQDTVELEPELGLASEGSDSSHDHPASPGSPHDDRKRTHSPLHEDVEMGGSGSSGSGTESHGNESHGNESHGNESVGSSNGNCKDSALLESSGSNKSSNSHSPSPPSSSNAFSLVSSEQDNPSTSGCSSEQSAKAKTQKELFKTLKELKMHLPIEKKSKGKSSTVNTLKYALRCVKQVKANEEYYQMLMINDSQPPGFEVSSYTIEEINSITSEYTLKNTDIFAVAVSLITGKIVYISDQAASILNCKREVFNNAKFVEFLTPQDVSVFYSFTTPYRLPSWSMCTGAESSPTECMQEKSFFCRISGGKEHEGDLQYYPFRMTPYLMKVQDAELSEEQFCCLLLAERVHSGYEAPRIPPDKRIFTTTHTPNCVFQDVDERAVPLLGYLPQDLIGSPVLANLHPSDRPLMLAVHRKILQYACQPFDHSSIRFCARNGEYVTIDTSWSSFVNPWSRKVSFVIGRHKVRMGPVNEDVFAAPSFHGGKMMDSDIQEISEQIHRLLLQPVHNIGSSGYGSHGSNGSHEPQVSISSSSESNGNLMVVNTAEEMGKSKPPRTFQEICKGVHMLKNQDSQVCLRSPPSSPAPSPSKPEQKKTTDTAAAQRSPAVRLKESAPPLQGKESTAASMEDFTCKDQTVCSYQQISCLDSVIRYLESCNIPITVKRKYQFSSNTTSSNSDDDKKESMQVPAGANTDPLIPELSNMKAPKKPPSGAAAVVGGPLAPLTLPSKAESVVSITSQCSYSSTIVHVGDKKPQPESEIIEDVAESPAPPAQPVSVVSPLSQEKEAYKRLGLTKQVLAAHTQKEEQAFLNRCRDIRNARTFQKECSTYLHKHRGRANAEEPSGLQGATKLGSTRPETGTKKGSRNRKSKKPRMKHPDSSDSAVSNRKPRPPLQGLNQTSWSPSEASLSAFNVSYPTMVPAYPLYPPAPAAPAQVPRPDPTLSTGFVERQSTQAPQPATPFPTPIVTPVVALVLPNYLFPQMGQLGQMGQIGAAPRSTFFPEQTQTQPPFTGQQSFQPPQAAFTMQTQPTFTNQPLFPVQTAFSPQQPFQTRQPAYNPQQSFAAQPSFPVQTQFVAQPPFPAQPFTYSLNPEPPKATTGEPREGAASRSSTPASGAREPATSPTLFESRCSSPLQLNLLSMEEGQRSVERQESTALSGGGQGNSTAALTGAAGALGEKISVSAKPDNHHQVDPPEDGGHSDGNSSSCDLLDILLQEQEDSHSGTGSATSGSLGSGSGSRLGSGSGSGCNGCGTSGSGASGSRTGSSNTSKYFGSIDSPEPGPNTKTKAKMRGEGDSQGGLLQTKVSSKGEGEHFIKYVLQEPLWLLMANADDKVMMTYQMPSRDIQKVLREDKERLRQMQKSQPHFSSDQRRELLEEHPWMRRGGLPSAINVKECVYCKDAAAAPIEEDLPDMDMGELGDEMGQEQPNNQSKSEKAQLDSGS